MRNKYIEKQTQNPDDIDAHCLLGKQFEWQYIILRIYFTEPAQHNPTGIQNYPENIVVGECIK